MHSVLIVDDEPRIRALIARWLAPDYDTSEAPDAEAALDLVTTDARDVVLCDIEMPGHGGLWLVERLRDQCPQVALVLATAVTTVPPKVSMQGGVVEYLVKPLDRERVRAAVSRAVEWREAALARGPAERATVDPIEAWLGGALSGTPKPDSERD